MFRSLTGDKHLSTFRSLTPFSSFVRTLLPILDFSLAEFTTFHFFLSKEFVTAALYGISHIIRLRASSVVSKTTLGYLFPRHEHYNHLRLCEHGLSSKSSRLSAFVYILIVFFFVIFRTINHFFKL